MDEKNYDRLKLKNQLCFPLYAASKEIVRRYRPYLDALDLTYTQYIVMMILWEEESVSAKELGERLFLDSGTLTPVLKYLEKKGYILRERSKEDERILLASLTRKGEEIKEKALGIPVAIAGCVKLDANESVELYRLLYKFLDTLE